MSEITLTDQSGNELKFKGCSIVEKEREVRATDNFTRKFFGKIYYQDDGGFVSELEYVTNAPGEKPLHWFEDIDTIPDVENSYYLFDSIEVLPIAGVNAQEKLRRTRQWTQISRANAELSFAMIDAVNLYAEEHGCLDRMKQPAAQSIWHKLLF